MKKCEAINDRYAAILEAFTTYMDTLGFAKTTRYDYSLFVASFLAYLERKGIVHIHGLSSQTVREYFSHLETKRGERTGEPFGSSHLNRNFGAVDKFLEFLFQTGAHDTPPPLRYTVEHNPKEPPSVLTVEEIRLLYATVPSTFAGLTFARREERQATVRLMLDLCYGCGLRRSEALNLKTEDVDFDQRIVRVLGAKGYKDRWVPMAKEVYLSLQTFVYHYRRCFTRRAGYLYPFKGYAIAEALQMLVVNCKNESLKAKEPTLHTLRHSIASHLLDAGMSIENIALILGHGSLESTQIYTHVHEDYEYCQ